MVLRDGDFSAVMIAKERLEGFLEKVKNGTREYVLKRRKHGVSDSDDEPESEFEG